MFNFIVAQKYAPPQTVQILLAPPLSYLFRENKIVFWFVIHSTDSRENQTDQVPSAKSDLRELLWEEDGAGAAPVPRLQKP